MAETIREIVIQAAEEFGDGDAVRYKTEKKEIASKSYAELKFLRKNWKIRSVNIVWCRKFW